MTARQLRDEIHHGRPLSRAESRRRAKILGLLQAGLPIASGASVSITEILAAQDTASHTTFTGTFTAAASIGDCVVLMLGHDTAGARPAGPISDSAGNSYTKATSTDTGWTTGGLSYYVCASLTAAIVANTTTIAFTTGSASNKIIKASRMTGVTSVSVDKTNNHSTLTTTTPNTNTTGTLTQATEAVFVAYGYACSGGTPTFAAPSGFSQTATAQQVANGGLVAISTCYELVAATTALNPTATLGTSQNCGGTIVTLKYTAGGSAPVNTVAPAVTGTTTVGQTLTTTNGTWTDDGSPTFTYAWQRDVAGNGVYSNISSATASTYVLVDADDACHVRCNVTDSTPDGNTTQASNAVGVVAEPVATNSVAPTISGSAPQASTLTCNSNGTWTHMGGTVATFTYQWTRAGSNITGATASTYQTVNADVGHAIGVKVTATNTGGASSAVASSNTVTPTTAGFHSGTLTGYTVMVADIVAEWAVPAGTNTADADALLLLLSD